MSKKINKNPEIFTDNIFLECSRRASISKNDSNNSIWRNNVGAGIVCNIGDTIEVNSAYLNCNGIGEGGSTIALDGRRLGDYTIKNIYSEVWHDWRDTKTYQVFDNKTTIRNIFYKNADAKCCFFAPSPLITSNALDQADDTLVMGSNNVEGYVPMQTTTAHTVLPMSYVKNDVIPAYKKYMDNTRYAIFKKDLTDALTNSTLSFDWKYYLFENDIELELPRGFNNVNSISDLITEKLNTVDPILAHYGYARKALLDDGWTLTNDPSDASISNIKIPTSFINSTPTYKAFKASTRYTQSLEAWQAFYGDEVNKDIYLENYEYIAIKNIDYYLAGSKFVNVPNLTPYTFTFNETIADNTVADQWVEFNFDWTKIQLLFNWLDTQQRTTRLLSHFGLYENSDTHPSRFIHISPIDMADLGSDMKVPYCSHVLPIYINTVLYGKKNNEDESSETNPYLGIFIKTSLTTMKMKISTKNLYVKFPITSLNRKVGYDKSFSAYGNDALMLYNGKNHLIGNENEPAPAPAPYVEPLTNTFNDGTDVFETDVATNWIYLGCDQPLFNFNSQLNKFEFSQLHSSPKTTNPYNALGTVDTKLIGINDDAGINIYTMNQVSDEIISQPNMKKTYTANDEFLIERFTIFDAYSSIGLLNLGISDNESVYNLFYRLGFSKEQLQVPTDIYTNQVKNNFNKSKSYPITTNAQVESADILQYSGNYFGASYYRDIPPNIQSNDTTTFQGPSMLTISPQVSTKFTADNIASKTNHSFYTIRSDIIGQYNYYGNNENESGQLINCVSIVSKENALQDFIYLSPLSNMVFTIKKPITIQSINTGIFNNDGSEAVIDDNSTIVYKITKATI